MSNFKVGEKVVCVDDTTCTQLKKGEIYTIIFVFTTGAVNVLEAKPDKPYIFFKMNRFRKLDHQFAEDLCKELAEQVQQENYQLC